MRRAALAIIWLLCSCNRQGDPAAAGPTLEAASPMPDVDKAMAPDASAARPTPSAAPIADDPDIETADAQHPNLADDATTAPRCWDDYCPCDRDDPDFGYLDVTLCRKLRMGMAVSDDEFSIGAAGRDARRALREFRRDNP